MNTCQVTLSNPGSPARYPCGAPAVALYRRAILCCEEHRKGLRGAGAKASDFTDTKGNPGYK